MNILLGIAAISILVFVHELGHYLVARWAGVAVDEFSVGLGPKLWARQWNGSLWTLRLLPFGGFVSLKGMTRHDRGWEDPDAFLQATSGKRVLILLGGVAANFLGGIVLGAFALGIRLRANIVDANRAVNGFTKAEWLFEVKDPRVYVDKVVLDSPAHRAGVLPGDRVLSVNGATQTRADEANAAIADRCLLKLQRDGTAFIVDVPVYNGSANPTFREDQVVRFHVLTALPAATVFTAGAVAIIAYKLPSLIVRAAEDMETSIGGPVALLAETKKAAEIGLAELLFYCWSTSISLIVFNLLPVPGLDGGRIFFLLPELLLRRKVNETVEILATVVGVLGLLTLFVLVTIKDIANLLP